MEYLDISPTILSGLFGNKIKCRYICAVKESKSILEHLLVRNSEKVPDEIRR